MSAVLMIVNIMIHIIFTLFPTSSSPVAIVFLLHLQHFPMSADLSDDRLFSNAAFGPWCSDPTFVAMKAAVGHCQTEFALMELFGGVGTAFIAFKALGLRVNIVYYSDMNRKLLRWISKLHKNLKSVHWGDILLVAVESLPSVQIIIAGPPCPPWSKKGIRGSWNDPRAKPFLHTLQIIIDQAHRGTLLFFILENVEGFCNKHNGSRPIDDVLKILLDGLPIDWVIDHNVYNSRDFGLPQNRPRLYIVGRKATNRKERLPLPLCQFHRKPMLSDIVDSCVTPAQLQRGYFFGQCGRGYTVPEQRNLQDYKVWYSLELQDSNFLGSIASFAYDRTPSSRRDWSITKRINHCECLTAHMSRLHFLSLGDKGSSLDRAALLSERGRLQGLPLWYIANDSPYAETVKAVGNGMSVPVVASVIYREIAFILGLGELIVDRGSPDVARQLSN